MVNDYELLKKIRELETTGTTIDASRNFKWKCLVFLLGLAAAIAMVRLLVEVIWG